jgi:hypothetical protein
MPVFWRDRGRVHLRSHRRGGKPPLLRAGASSRTPQGFWSGFGCFRIAAPAEGA